VSVNVFIRKDKSQKERWAKVYRYDVWGSRETKYAWLRNKSHITTPWKELRPKSPRFLFAESNEEFNEEYAKGWSLPEIFPLNSIGIATARDGLCIHFSRGAVES